MWPSSSIMSSSTVTNNSVRGGTGSSSSIKQDCCPDCGDTGPTMLGMDQTGVAVVRIILSKARPFAADAQLLLASNHHGRH